jgi:hypothetical protein
MVFIQSFLPSRETNLYEYQLFRFTVERFRVMKHSSGKMLKHVFNCLSVFSEALFVQVYNLKGIHVCGIIEAIATIRVLPSYLFQNHRGLPNELGVTSCLLIG